MKNKGIILCRDATVAALGTILTFDSPLPASATIAANLAFSARTRAILYTVTATAIARRNLCNQNCQKTEDSTSALFLGAGEMAEGLRSLPKEVQEVAYGEDSFSREVDKLIDLGSILLKFPKWRGQCLRLVNKAEEEILKHDFLMDEVASFSSDEEMEAWLEVEEVAREQDWRAGYVDAVKGIRETCRHKVVKELLEKCAAIGSFRKD